MEQNSLTYGLEIHMPFKWKQTPKSATYLLGFGKQKLPCMLQIPLGLNLQYHYLSLADINPLQRNRSSPSWPFKAIPCPRSLPTCVPQPPLSPPLFSASWSYPATVNCICNIVNVETLHF